MKKVSLLVFFVAMIGVLFSTIVDIRWLHLVTKPLIMSSLFIHYIFASQPENRSRMVMLAIICSLAGDVLLMNADYFVPGLSAFLLGHIFYISAYRQHQADETSDALRGIHRVRLAFPIILAGSGLVVILYPVLGSMRIPVMGYALVITVMAIVALFRYGRTSTASFWMVFGGAVLFMISDSIIAISKFLSPVAFSGFLIMLTYGSAQFLIIRGLLKHPLES